MKRVRDDTPAAESAALAERTADVMEAVHATPPVQILTQGLRNPFKAFGEAPLPLEVMLEAIARTYLADDPRAIAAIAGACRHFATAAWETVSRLVLKAGMQLTDSILINKLTHLTILDFRHGGAQAIGEITADGLLALAPRLVELHFGYHVRGPSDNPMTAAVILQMTQLRALTLPRNGLAGRPIRLSELSQLPNLTSLDTGKESLERQEMDEPFPSTLRRLAARDTQVPLTVSNARLLGQLRALDMGSFGLVADRHLAQLPRLEYRCATRGTTHPMPRCQTAAVAYPPRPA